MSLQIQLDPKTESRLAQEASRRGLDAHDYARILIEQSLPPEVPDSRSLWQTLSPEEWIREFEAWTDSHRDLPVLPPEAYERASFYEDRD